MKKLLKFVVAACAMLAVVACSNPEDKQDKSISILYPSWAEGVAITHLTDYVLTNKGYDVKTTLIEPGPLYASLAKGDADLYLDAWLPHTHKDYWERFGDKLDVSGVIFDDASSGLVVPSYVEIDSIEELNAHRAEFDGKIFGIGAGAGIHGKTLQAIEDYDLDYEQLTSSESAMMAALQGAVAAKKPIIITGWKPHYMWDLYDLKLLKDPKEIYLIDEITILSRKGFNQDQPEVAVFLQNFKLNSDQIHELIAMVGEDNRNPEEGAKKFYDKYKTEIDSWFK